MGGGQRKEVDTLRALGGSAILVGMLPTWQALGKLDVSIGGPERAGSLVRCNGCGGRGRRLVYVQDGPEDASPDWDYCAICQGQGQFALPVERFILERQARLGDVHPVFEDFLPEDEDDIEARPRRALRRLTDAA
jgi:hypothetical protein